MLRVYGGQPVAMGNAGALQALSPLYTTPLAPVWGGGPLVPGSAPGRESFLGPAPVNKYNMGAVGNVGGMLAQASPSAEASLFQEYASAFLNPFGFLEKTKNTVNKLNERTRKQEEMIQELLQK